MTTDGYTYPRPPDSERTESVRTAGGPGCSGGWTRRSLAVCLVIALCSGCTLHPDKEGAENHPPAIMKGAEPLPIDRGRDRACLLLHGFGSSPADFGPLPEMLDEAGWDVYAPLLPGHGTEPEDLARVTASEVYGAARGHYRELRDRYDRVALGGFSMGGCIATGLAVDEPPDRLLLVSPYYAIRYHWYYVLPPRWWNYLLSPVVWWVPVTSQVNRPGGESELVHYDWLPTKGVRMLFALRDGVLERTEGKRLRCPVLLIYSTGDNTASSGAMEDVLGRLTDGGYWPARFTDSNHHVLHDYDREEALRAALEFMQGPPPSEGGGPADSVPQ